MALQFFCAMRHGHIRWPRDYHLKSGTIHPIMKFNLSICAACLVTLGFSSIPAPSASAFTLIEDLVDCGDSEEDAVSGGIPMIDSYVGEASAEIAGTPTQAQLDALSTSASQDAFSNYLDAIRADAKGSGYKCDFLSCPTKYLHCFEAFDIGQMFNPASVSVVVGDPEDIGQGSWCVTVTIEIIGETLIDYNCSDCPIEF